MNLKALIGNYIPSNEVIDKKKQMFNTLVELLARDDIAETTRAPIVDELFGFIVDGDHVKLAIEWLDSGNIHK